MITSEMARAWVYRGDWVAECPYGDGYCTLLKGGQFMFHCGECHKVMEVEWPKDPDEIIEALDKRPMKVNRNWFPHDHFLAIKARLPHGQTVQELDEETDYHMREQ